MLKLYPFYFKLYPFYPYIKGCFPLYCTNIIKKFPLFTIKNLEYS